MRILWALPFLFCACDDGSGGGSYNGGDDDVCGAYIICNDGTCSESCTSCDQGCCSSHDGCE